MSTSVTFAEQRRLAERRTIRDRRLSGDRRKTARIGETSRRRSNKNYLALDLLGSVLAVAVSVIVLVFTGLFSGASSTHVQIMMITAIVYAYLVAFRRAFYS